MAINSYLLLNSFSCFLVFSFFLFLRYNEKWYVGVGCGNHDEGAQFCLFEAKDDTLANFTDRGSLYTTNVTFGEVDGNIVWQVSWKLHVSSTLAPGSYMTCMNARVC